MAAKANEIMLAEPDHPALIEGHGLALSIPEGLPIEQWEQVGRRLFAEMRATEDRATRINWYIGDWWVYGSAVDPATQRPRYGARARAVAEGIFGATSFGTCANFGTVARKIETSRRREALPFSLHVEVASLPASEADVLLLKAEEQRLSTRELRREVLRHRIAKGEFSFRGDDDPEYAGILAIARVWNREPVASRRQFFELAEEAASAGFGEIDP